MANSVRNAVITGRLCYSALTHPTVIGSDGGDSKYRATILIDKNNKEDLTKLKEAAKAAYIEKFGSDAFDRKPNGWSGINDGDQRDPDGLHDKSFYINCKSRTVPLCIDEKREPTDKLYDGCYVNIAIYASAWEYAGKRGVSYSFSGIQFCKDGPKISNRANIIDQFPIIDSGDSSDRADAPWTENSFDALDIM